MKYACAKTNLLKYLHVRYINVVQPCSVPEAIMIYVTITENVSTET